ncbi:MAG: hypothetical protein MUO68_19045, partial [Desulfobacteraceae bacterium]|nr:hypothetical protein [Desulfobacteraceae bacterium]
NIYVSQTIFLSDMGKNHAGHLVPALKMFSAIVAVVLVHDTLEVVSRKQIEELWKHVLATRHGSFLKIVK